MEFCKVTYSPPLTVLVPKLLPTTPVHRQVLLAELVHVAVAVAPTVRHVIARFSITGLVETRAASRAVSEIVINCILVDVLAAGKMSQLEISDCIWRYLGDQASYMSNFDLSLLFLFGFIILERMIASAEKIPCNISSATSGRTCLPYVARTP